MTFEAYKALISNDNFYIKGRFFTFQELQEWLQSNSDSTIEKSVKEVISLWINPHIHEIPIKTSGSTGQPKTILLKKEYIFHSAIKSLAYFKLKRKARIILVLPPDKIGGLMLIIRSIIGGLDLYYYTPRLNPFHNNNIPSAEFCALTPAQFSEISLHTEDLQKLRAVKKILLGGSAISSEMMAKIKQEPNQYFHSYGMTETISHVAVRILNGKSATPHFKALKGVTFRLNDNSQLIIDAPDLLSSALMTNDVVTLIDSTQMIWEGRIDNIINSGGIKIQPELIEEKISSFFVGNFYLIGISHETLGKQLVMITENEEGIKNKLEVLTKSHLEKLPKLERPRSIFIANKLERTPNGKIKRLTPDELEVVFQYI